MDLLCYFIETENKNAFVCRDNIVNTLIYDSKLCLTLLLYHFDKFGVFLQYYIGSSIFNCSGFDITSLTIALSIEYLFYYEF